MIALQILCQCQSDKVDGWEALVAVGTIMMMGITVLVFVILVAWDMFHGS